MNYFKKFSDNSHAIFFSILACLLVSVMIAVVRKMTNEFHPFFVVFMRNVFGLVFFLPMLLKNGLTFVKTKKPKLHFLRGINGLVGMMIWFVAVKEISLPDLVSFTFTVPIITTFAAMIFLKEKVSKNIWLALLIGFVGILVIIRPGFKEFNVFYLLALTTTFSWSGTNLLIKVMTRTEKSQVIVFYMTLIMFVLSIPLGFIYYQQVGVYDLLWFGALGITSNLAHISMSHAFSKADLSVVQPFDFTRLIFTSIIAYFAFDQILDLYTFIGALIIMIGVMFVIPRKKKEGVAINDVDL